MSIKHPQRTKFIATRSPAVSEAAQTPAHVVLMMFSTRQPPRSDQSAGLSFGSSTGYGPAFTRCFGSVGNEFGEDRWERSLPSLCCWSGMVSAWDNCLRNRWTISGDGAFVLASEVEMISFSAVSNFSAVSLGFRIYLQCRSARCIAYMRDSKISKGIAFATKNQVPKSKPNI
jgi:hypothetical protein